MGSINRRQFLILSAGLGAAISLPACRALLDRISSLGATSASTVTPTPAPASTLTPTVATPSTTVPRVLPTLPAPTAASSPLAIPQSVKPAAQPLIAPDIVIKPPSGGSKIGLHVVGGPRDGLDYFLERCAGAGRPVALVKCVGDFEVAFKAKRISDKTLTVGRVNAVFPSRKVELDMQAWEPSEFSPPPGTTYQTAQEAAQQYYAFVKPIWQLNPVIDVWETFNEFSWHWDWQADFYIVLMDLAEADGYRLGLCQPAPVIHPKSFILLSRELAGAPKRMAITSCACMNTTSATC